MLFLLARDLEDTLIELLPWLVPVLIAVVAGVGRLLSVMLERRVEKMRQYEAEGGGVKRPSVPTGDASRPTSSESPTAPPQPRRTILEEIRRYMEMMEERSLGGPEDRPGRRGERRPQTQPDQRRPTAVPAPPGPPADEAFEEWQGQPVPDDRGTDLGAPTRPAPPRAPVRSKPIVETPLTEIVPAGYASAEARARGARLTAGAREIVEDPFEDFWKLQATGRHSLRPRLNARSARQAIVLATILGPPRAESPLDDDPTGARL